MFGIGAWELLILGFCCFVSFSLLVGVIASIVLATRGGRGQS